MAAAAHNPKFAKKVGIPPKVAKDFNQADKGSSMLSNAMVENTARKASRAPGGSRPTSAKPF